MPQRLSFEQLVTFITPFKSLKTQ